MVRQEKKCKNPGCDEIIYYFENPKKLFCDSTCKSRYHYLKDTKENAEIISLNKALRKNYKIIINFIANDIFIVDAEVARALGFQTNVFMDFNNFTIGRKQYINLRRLKDVYFVYNEVRNVIIIYFFENKKEVA
jgi:hypothetical protein